MYLTLKALHIIAVISWMAGLLYLPRLFVYHAASEPGSQQSETFKVMERRLYKFIMMPAMIVAWVLGIVLVFEGQWFASGWFVAKFILVIALTIVHGLLGHCTTEFCYDRNRHPQKFFRIVNEIPTVLMIAIVILATVKSF
jgi:putative membrane protein